MTNTCEWNRSTGAEPDKARSCEARAVKDGYCAWHHRAERYTRVAETGGWAEALAAPTLNAVSSQNSEVARSKTRGAKAKVRAIADAGEMPKKPKTAVAA